MTKNVRDIMDKYFNRARLITHNKTWSGSRGKNAQKTRLKSALNEVVFIVDLVFENVWRFTFQIAARRPFCLALYIWMIVLSCQHTRTALFSLVGPNRVQNIEEPMKIFSTKYSLRLSMLILVLQDLKVIDVTLHCRSRDRFYYLKNINNTQ